MSNKKTVLITGATDGLGKLVAQRIAARGDRVLLHGRNPAKGKAAVAEIRQATGNPDLHYFNADLASLRQTRELAAAILKSQPRLDVLVNNAGIGPVSADSPRRESPEGNELFLSVNYLSGCLLARELLPLLRSSVPARIVNVASIGQQALDFDDVMLQKAYDDARAYRQSKLAQIMFTIDLAEELKGSGITVNCLHPATLMNTGMVSASKYFPGPMTTTEQGADALEQLILSPKLATVSGAFYNGLEPGRANDQAYDAAARRKLREITAALIKS
jgi:NAD(P)-dependent dehydrogenase (short-subunit alcohol dehydrogenase family)